MPWNSLYCAIFAKNKKYCVTKTGEGGMLTKVYGRSRGEGGDQKVAWNLAKMVHVDRVNGPLVKYIKYVIKIPGSPQKFVCFASKLVYVAWG